MTSGCPDKQYYDEVVGRCQGCHDICYGSFLHDPTSDCNRFCPGLMEKLLDDKSTISTDTLNITEIVLIFCSTLILVSLIMGFIWWRLRSRRQSHRRNPSHTTETRPTQAEEMAMSELYIGTYPSDHLLTTSEV